MNLLERTPLHAWVFALALTAIALVLSLVVLPWMEPAFFLPFLGVVWLSSWYHGRMGGLVATLAAAVAIPFFFLPPILSFAIESPRGGVRVGAFIVVATILTWSTAAWKEHRSLLASTLSSVAEGVVVTDSSGRITFMNAVAETLTGWLASDCRGRLVGSIVRFLGEKNREPLEDPLLKALSDRVPSSANVFLVSKSGAEVPVEFSAAPVRDDAGVIRGGILVFRDIGTRLNLEEQLTHSQKMDAVGRLAGGVAGDFNNVLTVITGYAELLRAEFPSTNPMRRFVDEILYASERAAALTRHLLAFSKGTSAQARVIDLNAVIRAMEPMVRRLMGRDIEVILLNGPGLGRVRADPAQIEQVVVNLASNSRDAMQNGGKLVIETANSEVDEAAAKNLGVQPGSYVMLAVSDNGTGMDAETKSRLFEPFFTTKAPGKGSGLGLSTVYGAIKQSDGQVSVYSQPGCGTIFEIYLPRVKDAPSPLKRPSPRGSETILLVDDEEGVRKLVAAILSGNGYEVIEAANGVAALAVYDKNQHKIDMVLTDIVMPQMNGFELGKQLIGKAPELRILYMSGYRDNPAGGPSGETPRSFLHKPFTPDVLLAKVREVLDE
jgi:PAS domain S-box-containing protein